MDLCTALWLDGWLAKLFPVSNLTKSVSVLKMCSGYNLEWSCFWRLGSFGLLYGYLLCLHSNCCSPQQWMWGFGWPIMPGWPAAVRQTQRAAFRWATLIRRSHLLLPGETSWFWSWIFWIICCKNDDVIWFWGGKWGRSLLEIWNLLGLRLNPSSLVVEACRYER